MRSKDFNDARDCLTAALSKQCLTVSDITRMMSAETVAKQVAALGPPPRAELDGEPWMEDAAGHVEVSSSEQHIGALNRAVAPATCLLADADAKTSCFVDILEKDHSAGGVTIAVKDIFRFADHLPTAGLPTPPEGLQLAQTPLISRLKQAGAQIVATTKLSAWCYIPFEFNDLVTPPRHPHSSDLLVGGSSSGAAVAVASGAVSVALASDTGGSTRVPAALCGVYGFKPSRAAIDAGGAVPLGETQDTIGILARSIEDLRKTYSVISCLEPDSAGLRQLRRVAVPKGAFQLCQQPILTARNNTVRRLRTLGYDVAQSPTVDLTRMNATAGLITGFEAARFHLHRMAAFSNEYPDSIRRRLLVGAGVTPAVYSSAHQVRRTCLDEMNRSVFKEFDFILFPVVNQYKMKRPDAWPRMSGAQIGSLSLELLSLNRWVNLLGLPSISVPVECGGDVPAAVQIVGRLGSDHDVLHLASELDECTLSPN